MSTVSSYLQYSFHELVIKIQIGHYKEDTKRSSITCQDITQGQMSYEVALRMVEWDQTADETIDIHTSMIVWLGKLSTLFHMGSPWFSSLIYTKSQFIFSGCNLCLRKSETWLHPLCKVEEDVFFIVKFHMLAVPPPLIHLSHHFLTYFHSISLSLPIILELSFSPPPAFFLTPYTLSFSLSGKKRG